MRLRKRFVPIAGLAPEYARGSEPDFNGVRAETGFDGARAEVGP